MKITSIACSLLLTACTTAINMQGQPIELSPVACNVKIYQTYNAAIAQGPIEELCVITGETAFSFERSVRVAIEQNKGKVCSCGTGDAYIQSRHEADALGGQASVTLVAFRRLK